MRSSSFLNSGDSTWSSVNLYVVGIKLNQCVHSRAAQGKVHALVEYYERTTLKEVDVPVKEPVSLRDEQSVED